MNILAVTLNFSEMGPEHISIYCNDTIKFRFQKPIYSSELLSGNQEKLCINAW